MSQSTSPNTAEPRLCKMGCGFFGSGATEDCCSKCFLENQKKLGCQPVSVPQRTEEIAPEEEQQQQHEPMDVEEPTVEVAITATSTTEQPSAADGSLLNKKKKKTSYKAMMAAMTKSDAPRDLEKEKEAIRKTTGGGAFSKIEKI